MKKKLFTLLTLLCLCVTGTWATETTITLSGATTKGSKSDTMGPSGITSSSATITTGALGSSCATSGYHLTTSDGKYCTYGGTNYYLMHTYDGNNSKASWSAAGLTNQYGTFTVPSGYTYKITKVSHALASQSATFTAKIIVKNAASVNQYESANITVASVSDKNAASLTDIELATADQVTLTAGTYTLNVNISSTNTNTGKYCGIAKVILTGDLETAGVDTSSPEITTDLNDETPYVAYLGTQTSLFISANHFTGFQWYKCDDTSKTNATAIEGATESIYSFTPSAVGTKYYYCVVTNSNATGTKTATSKVATVNMQAVTPTFVLSSNDIVVGETAKIQVSGKTNLDGLSMTDLTYDNTVIGISDAGIITGLAPGTSTITFTTAASGNYAAGSANLSIIVTGKVVASSTPSTWDNATERTWSISKIAFNGIDEGGDNGLYFTTGDDNSIKYSSGDFFSLKPGNTMYVEVPSASSVGTITIKSTQTNERYLVVTNSEGDQHLVMSTSGNTVAFDAASIQTIGGKYYIEVAQGSGECKLPPSNFATVRIASTKNLNASGYSTYSGSYDVIVSGADAYKATLNTAAKTISCEKIENNKIPAGTGVILFKEANAEVTLTPTYGVAAIEGNDLKATTKADGSLATMDGSKFYYALSGDTFKHYTGAAFVAGKAYFESDTELNSKAFAIVFDSETTAINGIEEVAPKTTKTRKVVKNGRLVIETANGEFTIDGTRVK